VVWRLSVSENPFVNKPVAQGQVALALMVEWLQLLANRGEISLSQLEEIKEGAVRRFEPEGQASVRSIVNDALQVTQG